MTRRHLAFLILFAWLGALGWLAAREYARRGARAVLGHQVVSPGAGYYRVMLDSAQVGYGLLQVDTLAPTDSTPALVYLQSRLLISGGAAPDIERFEVITAAYLTTDLRLWRSQTMRGDPSGIAEWGVVVRGDTLLTTVVAGGQQWHSVAVVDTVPVPAEALPLWIATYARPRPGSSAALEVIDLATLDLRREQWVATADSTFLVPDSVIRTGPEQYRIASYDTVRAWRLGGTDRSVQVHRWIDENGFPLTWATGGGLRWERDAFEFAIGGFRRVSDSISGRSALQGPPRADAVALRLPGNGSWRVSLPGAEYPPLDGAGPTQRISGDTVETFAPNSWRSMQAYRPLEPLPMQNPRFRSELMPEPRLSPEDSAITREAMALAGNTQNAREAAMILSTWVQSHIATTFGGASMRPAAAVLAERSGTPEEKAVLLVAMARRVGLPARLAGGIIFTPRGLRTHTWAELFIGDWVPTDPTQEGLTASSTHLRLVAGGTGSWTDLFPLAGRFVASGREPAELP